MDSITQIALGAAVGEACLGKKLGNKAAGWGALFGVVPDLDVLASPFLSNVQELVVHRGITHSLLFIVIAAPLFGWLLCRFYKKEISWRRWSLMVFLVISTHIFIDVCTSYGTQVFQPFSNYTASFNSIFIIDPFYTLPLLGGVISALFMRRQLFKRRWINYIGLGLSSAYMLAGFFIKAHVNAVFEDNFSRQQITVEQYMTTPMPLTEFLWVGYAQHDGQIYAGLYSIFDEDRHIAFQSTAMNEQLIKPYKDQLPVKRILWFSDGYYAASQSEDELFMHDLRFGRTNLWLNEEPTPFVWNYRLQFNADSSKVTGFERKEPAFDFSGKQFSKLFERVIGKE